MGATLTALGKYVPSRIMTNDDLAKIVATSDEWITTRTGIRERRIAAEDETTSTLAAQAARDVLAKRGISPTEVEMIVVATMMPDSPFPSTACKVQDLIGAVNASAFDVSAACSGFVYAMETAAAFVKTGAVKNALVIGAEVYSRFLDWEDRRTCVLFGDGAAAAFLEAGEDNNFFGCALKADGSGAHLLHMPGGGTARPSSADTVQNRDHFLKMNGLELFQQVVPMACDSILDVCEKAGLEVGDIDLIVPHQANVHIIEAVSDAMDIPMEKFMLNLDKYGNTGAASIPLALQDALDQNRVKAGDKLLLIGFGAGLTCAASIVRWDESFIG